MQSAAGIQLITAQLIEDVTEQARKSPRQRKNYNFHTGNEDNPHRFLNVFLAGSYVQPHRHLEPPKAEAFLVLAGHMAAFIFDDDGKVVHGYLLGAGPFTGRVPSRITEPGVVQGIDLQPGLWHSIASLTPVAVCYEVKPGPWAPATDKEFATWAPREGEAACAAHLADLLA
jgi:cupin fold WbuC family metalloprotein